MIFEFTRTVRDRETVEVEADTYEEAITRLLRDGIGSEGISESRCEPDDSEEWDTVTTYETDGKFKTRPLVTSVDIDPYRS